MNFYSIGEFSKLIRKTTQTLRNWDKNNVLKSHHITNSGYMYYLQEQFNHFLGGLKSKVQLNKKI